MRVTPTALPDVLLLEPTVVRDDRGCFLETYNRRVFHDAVGHAVDFVQDNHSRSRRGVLRGLHYQLPPHAQGKLVRVTHGSAFDVAVDLRRGTPTFGRWVGMTLHAHSHQQLWIPPGFAHGFLALEDDTDFVYKTTAYYARDHERSIAWNDPTLAIDWPSCGEPVSLSAKDAAAPHFEQATVFDTHQGPAGPDVPRA